MLLDEAAHPRSTLAGSRRAMQSERPIVLHSLPMSTRASVPTDVAASRTRNRVIKQDCLPTRSKSGAVPKVRENR